MLDKIIVNVIIFLFTIGLIICGIIEGLIRLIFFVVEYTIKGKSSAFCEYYCYEFLFDK